MKAVRILGVLSAVAFAAGIALAQEGAAPPPLKLSFDLGATFADGNSESMKGNASLSMQGERPALGSVLGGIQVNYGESKVNGETETDVDNAKAFVNAKKTATAKTFVYGDTSILYDNVAEIDYRVTAGPGAGVYLVKTAADAFSLEAGPTYIWERVTEEDDNYLAVRAAQRYEHAVAPGTRFWEALEYLPEAADFRNYLVNAEAGAEAAVNARFSLRLVLQDKYDSEPGPGMEKNDVTLIGGISIKL